jgi:hypothetical protein
MNPQIYFLSLKMSWKQYQIISDTSQRRRVPAPIHADLGFFK